MNGVIYDVAYTDDLAYYEWLCEKYGEEVEEGGDPYCEHARILDALFSEEKQVERMEWPAEQTKKESKMTKSDMRQQIKALRVQMASIETECKAREDKLINLLLVLEPFLNAMTPQMHKNVMDALDE